MERYHVPLTVLLWLLIEIFDFDVHHSVDRPPGGYSDGMYNFADIVVHGHAGHVG